MTPTLPLPAALLGAAGLLPFLGLAALAGFGVPQAAPALAAYGATILAFLGAVHWGLALAGPSPANVARLGLGVVPSLIGFAALLLPVRQGLAVLAVATLATAAVETLAARRGLVPWDYLKLRWLLSAGAACCLGIGAWVAMG
ncbi:DUF3429 domain-containing protein [Falsiroseomonas sp. E2-1-a20]|uniref:DUF3429 domain-containing protein n=1 Tax=Falsiroseomonas sp. E2-1-a20 TaxID=3239300 RepID=UPI003F2B4813